MANVGKMLAYLAYTWRVKKKRRKDGDAFPPERKKEVDAGSQRTVRDSVAMHATVSYIRDTQKQPRIAKSSQPREGGHDTQRG